MDTTCENKSKYRQKISQTIEYVRQRHWLCAVLFGLATFLLLVPFLNNYVFASDEAEIFMHGQVISHGGLLYVDTASQHMPVMYYLAALFSLFGASTVIGFRFWFFLLNAAIWGLMYYRYAPKRGRLSFCLYPIIYILILPQIDWTAACVLSDGFQGLGMAILLFEFMEFVETKRISISSACMYSLAIFISFGSAFVAAFAIFIMVLLLFVLDIWNSIKERRGFLGYLVHFAKYYIPTILIVLLPFALLLLFYVLTGTLDDFINWAYVLNRTVYVNYVGGYGSSVLSGFFGGAIYFKDALLYPFGSTAAMIQLFMILCCIGWIIKHLKDGNAPVIRIIGVLLFMIACATRGLFSFHGLPAVAVLSIMTADFLSGYVKKILAFSKKGLLQTTVTVSLVFVLAFPYLIYAGATPLTVLRNEAPRETTPWYLDVITDKDERVGFSTLECNYMVVADVRPASIQGGSVPWFWDYAGEQAMKELTEAPPRVFLFSVNHEVWGYKIVDYAPELTEFITTNYTPLHEVNQPTLWVLNDYYDEAIQKINEAKSK